ncbi:hypothetical protein VNI00_019257 [Paramarasmius palmivorus]|uniref:Uncharacterized protein n=1 Tax=Paramarasmius palmivorus TaxID=297713 RepID=A0AAW0AQR4_9AGAR
MTPVFWNLIKKPVWCILPSPGLRGRRDVAKAHIRAITHSVPTSQVWQEAIDISLASKKRPALKERLIKATPSSQSMRHPQIDYNRIEEVLSIREEDFHTFEQTLLDAIDNYVELEQQWLKSGHEVNPPPPFTV